MLRRRRAAWGSSSGPIRLKFADTTQAPCTYMQAVETQDELALSALLQLPTAQLGLQGELQQGSPHVWRRGGQGKVWLCTARTEGHL